MKKNDTVYSQTCSGRDGINEESLKVKVMMISEVIVRCKTQM